MEAWFLEPLTEVSILKKFSYLLNNETANIEIREEIGDENIWLFGALTHEVEDIRYNKM